MNKASSLRLLPLLGIFAAGLLLAGCPKAPVAEPLPPPPQIVSFGASPARLDAPGNATLSWETKDSSRVQIFDSTNTEVSGVDDRAAGSIEVTLAGTAMFVMRASNARGVADSAAAQVEVASGPVEMLLTAVPSEVPAGEVSVLAWSSAGAKSVRITDSNGGVVELNGQGAFGTVTVQPQADTTYTLTADGRTATTAVKVRPVIDLLEASPAFAVPGGTVTVSWKSRGAIKAVLTDPLRGALVTEADPAKVAAGSFVQTIPATAATGEVYAYELRVEGANLSSTHQSLQVYVGDQAAVKTFTGPEYARAGATFTLKWTTTGADLVELSAGGVAFYQSPAASVAASGSLALAAPLQTTEYTLTARNRRGSSATAKWTVSPVGITNLGSFTASPAAVAAGGDPVTLTWSAPNARRLSIVANGEYTVLTRSGPSAESGSLTVYPNEATTYLLSAHNTVGDAVTATDSATVTSPAIFGVTPSGPIPNGGSLSLAYSVGGAGALAYGMAHGTVDATPNSTGFIDISTTGAKLNFAATADNATTSFTPEPVFESWLWGNRVAGKVVVSTNGFFVFGASASSRSTTAAIPNGTIERNFIAPLWEDLLFTAASAVHWEVRGDAPERVLIVQWSKVGMKGEAGSTLTFQAQVHQTGEVRFEYRTLTFTTGTPVVGIQGPSATAGLAAPSGAASDLGLTFFKPQATPVSFKAAQGAVAAGWVKIGAAYLKLTHTPVLIPARDLVVSEAMYSPAAAISTTGEWLEITNASSTAYDLDGWTLNLGGSSQHTIAAANGSTIVPAGGSLLLGQSAPGAATDGVAVQYVYGTSLAMDDTSGSVALERAGAIVASLGWAAGQGGVGVSVVTDPGPILLSSDATGTAPHGLTGSATLPFGTQVPQQLGTPGSRSAVYPYTLRSIPVAFVDISSTGTAVLDNTGSDNQTGTASLTTAPFSYFGGAPQTSMKINSNGWLLLGTTTATTYINRALPSTTASPKGIIAPFWDDLYFGSAANSNVYVQHLPTNADPTNPGGHWVVQWHNFGHSTGDDMNFEVKLFDNGIVEFHFASMTSASSSNYADGNSATSWIEKPDGTSALVVNVNTAGGIQPNSAYRFTP
ncbi:MAG: lamin tail domain-containing protein [Myxococcaceae bacterium]